MKARTESGEFEISIEKEDPSGNWYWVTGLPDNLPETFELVDNPIYYIHFTVSRLIRDGSVKRSETGAVLYQITMMGNKKALRGLFHE